MIPGLYHGSGGGAEERVLLVMLPGLGIKASDFVEHGLVRSVHARGLAVDILAADPDPDRYLDGTVVAEIDRAISASARPLDHAHLWFLGISLGGMGALLYAGAGLARVEGIVLLAPFLGTQATMSEIADAGGIASWSADGSAGTGLERQMLLGLQNFLAEPAAAPALYLGFGVGDRFAPRYADLAARLPENRVFTRAGGHDWDTWAKLWDQVLDAGPFAGRRFAAREMRPR